MTPALLLQFFAILAGGACFIAFLLIILILAYKLINQSAPEYYEEQPEEDMVAISPTLKLTKEQYDIYLEV